MAAAIGYDQQPEFEIRAPGQRTMSERLEWEIRNSNGPLRRAVEAEGLMEDWTDDKDKAKL